MCVFSWEQVKIRRAVIVFSGVTMVNRFLSGDKAIKNVFCNNYRFFYISPYVGSAMVRRPYVPIISHFYFSPLPVRIHGTFTIFGVLLSRFVRDTNFLVPSHNASSYLILSSVSVWFTFTCSVINYSFFKTFIGHLAFGRAIKLSVAKVFISANYTDIINFFWHNKPPWFSMLPYRLVAVT